MLPRNVMKQLQIVFLMIGLGFMLTVGYRLKGNAVEYNPIPLDASVSGVRCSAKLYESRAEYPLCYDLQEKLNIATGDGDYSAVRDAIRQGANVNGRYSHSFAPLFVAVKMGQGKIVELLLENGADPNAKEVWNQTPLHQIGIPKGKSPEEVREIVGMLVGNGADICSLTSENTTALDGAKMMGNGVAAQALNDYGARFCIRQYVRW
jgi:hypothetical protein